MESLIVLPSVVQRRPNKNYILVDTKNFTIDWCCKNICGMQFSNVEIWASDDPAASCYALSRARSECGVSILLTKTVWEALEGVYKIQCMSPEQIEEIKEICDIVEDLNVSY